MLNKKEGKEFEIIMTYEMVNSRLIRLFPHWELVHQLVSILTAMKLHKYKRFLEYEEENS